MLFLNARFACEFSFVKMFLLILHNFVWRKACTFQVKSCVAFITFNARGRNASAFAHTAELPIRWEGRKTDGEDENSAALVLKASAVERGEASKRYDGIFCAMCPWTAEVQQRFGRGQGILPTRKGGSDGSSEEGSEAKLETAGGE